MQAKDIIQEIDPEYIRCKWCRRMIHTSKATSVLFSDDSACKDIEKCTDVYNKLHSDRYKKWTAKI